MEIGGAMRQIRSGTTEQDRIVSVHIVVDKCVSDGCRSVGVPDDGDVLGVQAVWVTQSPLTSAANRAAPFRAIPGSLTRRSDAPCGASNPIQAITEL